MNMNIGGGRLVIPAILHKGHGTIYKCYGARISSTKITTPTKSNAESNLLHGLWKEKEGEIEHFSGSRLGPKLELF